MIIVYETVSNEKIHKGAIDLKKKIKAFFIANPKRRKCIVSVWYGKKIDVKKHNIDEVIDAAVLAAIK